MYTLFDAKNNIETTTDTVRLRVVLTLAENGESRDGLRAIGIQLKYLQNSHQFEDEDVSILIQNAQVVVSIEIEIVYVTEEMEETQRSNDSLSAHDDVGALRIN